jgi:ATPase subunit of ABC transporter with duplicated ATPase domains
MSSDPKRGKMMRTRSNIIARMQDRQADKVIKEQSIALTATSHSRTGKQLVKMNKMNVSIAGRTLISNINLTIHSGDKIAIL